MKILELRLKNLNSLYGEWIIDFTEPEYVSSGIFALTGPTGAGKSTVLDAICLALYGGTPRLGKITKSGNEIMSRQTGECYAEVLFESQAGRFRCHWEQRRARKRADGKLQDQEHQIVDADTGKPLETKKSLVSGVIEEKTGMDFDRFTRSILLAQGGFDIFLKSDAEQKSKILEQITGTEIYSAISRSVHERQRDEREKLNLLQAETSGIVILDLEEEKEMQLRLKIKQEEEADLIGKSTDTETAITWLTSIDGLKKEISSLAEEAVKLQGDNADFKPERDRLVRARKAASLDGVYATLTEIRKQQSDDQASLKAEEAVFPELEALAEEQDELLKSAEQQTAKAKEELKTAVPLIQNVRALDQKLSGQEKTVSESEESCIKDAVKIDDGKEVRATVQEKRNEAEKDLDLIEDYLKEHAQDAWLIGGLAGVEEQLNALLVKQKEIVRKEADLKKADEVLEQAIPNLDECTEQCRIRKLELDDASRNLQQGKNILSELLAGRQLREYRTEKETLLREMAFLSKIAELEEYRSKLEDGKPCPLCGAKEHPFADGNVPVSDENEKKIDSLTEIISRAEDQDAANQKLEESEAVARGNLTACEKREAAAANDKKAAGKDLAEVKEGLENLRAGYAELKQAVSEKLQPLGITEIPDADVVSLLESLKDRLDAWHAQVKNKEEIEKQIAELDNEMKRQDAVIETLTAALAERQERLEALKKEHTAGSVERKELYGDKNPDDEESRLNTAVADAEDAEKMSRVLHNEMQQKVTSAKTHVQSLKKRIGQREPELKNAEADFYSALAPAGFSDEKQFLDAGLSTEQQEVLSSRAKALDDRQTDLNARQKDREARLATERARKVTDKTHEELEVQCREYEGSLKELRDAISGLKHKLSENSVAKERAEEKQVTIEARKRECRRWDKLHGLIGSADGKKYRNFAQGLTFELMVGHANRQLQKMNDRYLLLRDDAQPLELNVIDNYQAGEIRSTRNLFRW